MTTTTTDPTKPDDEVHPHKPHSDEVHRGADLQRYTGSVAASWLEILTDVNPLLESEAACAAIQDLTAQMMTLLEMDALDLEAAGRLGVQIEEMDSFQPQDLQAVQAGLLRALAENLGQAVWAELQFKISDLLFALGSGFYAGKAHRASRFEMTAMSRMGHDLKTPVNAITGFSRVILKGIDGPITDFQREDLTSIYESGQNLLAMINDLFSVRKLDAARTLIYEAPFEVSELLADVVRTVQPLAADRGHTFTLQVEGDLGSLSLDPSRVRWILLGLLSYAIRQVTGSSIRVEARKTSADGAWLTFDVTCRSPEALQVYSDDAAQTGKDATLWSDEIGLGTCRRFCEQMGGSLTVSSGDTIAFTVCLPTDGRNFTTDAA